MSDSDLARSLADLKTSVNALPARVTAALKAVAHDTSTRILSGYRQRLLAQTKAVHTAASATIIDESGDKRFVVHVPGEHGNDKALWFEHGTKKMPAKPALRPAGDGENERYKQNMAAAAERSAQETLT